MKGSLPGRVLWVKIPGRRHGLRPLQVTSRSGGVGGKTPPCGLPRPWRGGVLLGFLSRETRPQLGSCLRCSGTGEEGQKLAVSKHNYSRSDRPVQYSIDRFTLATWSPALPEAPLPHSLSLVLKAYLPPLPARVLDPREGQGPVFSLGPEQKTGGGGDTQLTLQQGPPPSCPLPPTSGLRSVTIKPLPTSSWAYRAGPPNPRLL